MAILEDILWTAGFLEGEGSFIVWKSMNGDLRPKVAATQVNREPLDRLVAIWGGTVSVSRRATDTRQELLAWSLWHSRAAALMRAVRPFMSERRIGQIDKALALNPGVKRLGQTHCDHGHLFDEANTYYTKDGRRSCRACHRRWAREWRERNSQPRNRGHGRPRGRKVKA